MPHISIDPRRFVFCFSRRLLIVALASSTFAFAQNTSNPVAPTTPNSEPAPPAVEGKTEVAAKSAAVTVMPTFSSLTAGGALTGWTFQPLRGVKKTTLYTATQDKEVGRVVIDAKAQGGAAALGVRLDHDAKVHHALRFSWKVGNLIESSDPTTKAGDDYAARVYVTFVHEPARATFRERAENTIFRTLYGETPPRAALAYVFTHKAKVGEVITSPFTSRVKKIVIDADVNSVGKWKSFERDVYADYKRAFNEEPTRISGIAIMVDTDNTGETASARFGDISLSEK
jgi:hypothetical protein